MALGTKDSPKALIGASIPRSGHHFLQNLLSTYYGEQLYYCEFYSPKDCCKTFPCTRRGNHRIIYQKSHDRDQEVPTDIADAFYVIQYRHPVPEAVSDRELDLEDALGRRCVDYRTTREHYLGWLAQKAVYYRKFHDKWMKERVPNGAYVDYAELSQDARPAMSAIVGWASGSVDNALMDRVIGEQGGSRVSSPVTGPADKVFKPRVPQESPNFDADLLGAFEDYVLERCPAFGFQRMLAGSYRNHPLHAFIMLADPNEPLPPGEKNRWAAVEKLAPNHPDIVVRKAQREMRDGKIDSAIARLEGLIKERPFFPAAYRLLFSMSKKAGKPVNGNLFDGNSILAVSDNPELLTDLAATFISREHVVSAMTCLSLALLLQPDHPRANHLMANTLAEEKKWAQAEPYAARAIKVQPNNEPAAKLLNRIRRRIA